MKKISIIGSGVMGTIFLKAALETNQGSEIIITDRSEEKLEEIHKEHPQVITSTDNVQAIKDADLIILAVKPQSFSELGKEIQGNINKDALVVSVMAGIGLEEIQNTLGTNDIVRTMPNLGARVGKSMTVWTCTDGVDREIVTKLLKSIGQELFVENEEMIDKATAVSGSGPGFFYHIMEEWTKATIDLGFSEAEAQQLLLATIDGANELWQKEKDASDLKSQVASKGGTTEAGLNILKESNIDQILQKTLQAALSRAKELSK